MVSLQSRYRGAGGWAERSDDCTSCTGGSPGWPNLSTDTLKYDSVYVVYSRLGRDSLRVNVRGKAQRVLLDALGRVRISAPWHTDYPAEVDSFRYDLGGRLRYQWTRRAVQIEHQYDSRNRDTLTVVPGVGSYRNAFAGPNDELTRAWIDSYVDSIGGVNPEVRYGYSQAGWLLADTSQGSRVVTHKYDRYGRDTSMTDVNGTWKMRFDTERGALDTVVTPFSDSLLYGYDSWGRVTGPTVRSSSGSSLVASMAWSAAGQLRSVTFNHGNYLLGGLINVDTTDAENNLRLGWGEQHGSGDSQRNSDDSLSNDAFGRVLAVGYVRTGSLIATDTFQFDRDGGIRVKGESRAYDTTNMRMSERAGSYYGYDAAGNLTSGANFNYGYDALDRLVSVRSSGTLIARYGYDVLGRRIVRRVYAAGPNGATAVYSRMIYNGGQVTAETDSAGTTLTLGYTWGLGADDLVGVHKYADTTDYEVAQDGLRSVRAVAKRDGTWYATFRYRAFGAGLDSAGSVPFRLRYRWIGREFDEETGLYYVRARYYDPASQQFTQEDPIGFAGGANVYAYGDGNPSNGRDIDGLDKDPDLTGRDPNDDWFRACMGTTGGCGGGGAYSPLEGFAGMSVFDFMSSFEKTADYDRYLAAYNRLWSSSTTVDAKVRAMSPTEFATMAQAVLTIGPGGSVANERRVLIYDWIVGFGTVGVETNLSANSAVNRTSCCGIGTTPGYTEVGYAHTRDGRPIPFSFIHPDTFAMPLSFVADVIVHEVLHQFGGTHCTIYRETYRLTHVTHHPPPNIGACAYP